MPLLLEDLVLRKAELLLCQHALARTGSIMEAAQLLGITRHALKRRMIKHGLASPREQLATGVLPHEHRPPERVTRRSAPPKGT